MKTPIHTKSCDYHNYGSIDDHDHDGHVVRPMNDLPTLERLDPDSIISIPWHTRDLSRDDVVARAHRSHHDFSSLNHLKLKAVNGDKYCHQNRYLYNNHKAYPNHNHDDDERRLTRMAYGLLVTGVVVLLACLTQEITGLLAS